MKIPITLFQEGGGGHNDLDLLCLPQNSCKKNCAHSKFLTIFHTFIKYFMLFIIPLRFFYNDRPLVKRAYQKIFFLFLNKIICCGYSKEPSRLDGSFEHQKTYVKIDG